MNRTSFSGPKTLFVLGNGFDKHHQIGSSYGEFKQWLLDNRPVVNSALERIYQNTTDGWWRSFEQNLANFDPDKYPEMIAEKPFFDLKHELECLYGAEATDLIDNYDYQGDNDVANRYRLAPEIARFELRRLKEELFAAFEDWVNSLIMPSSFEKVNGINEDAVYLNFNYTKTLEILYEIDDAYIYHIHGSVDGGRFVIGHGKTADQMMEDDFEKHVYERDINNDRGEEEVRQALFDAIDEEMRKPVEDIIYEYQDFFNSLGSIQQLVVLGFSYSPIDLPYLRRIIDETGPDIKVIFGWHVENDKVDAARFRDEMKLTNCELEYF